MSRVAYNFAILRVVPHVDTGAFVNIGVILHARTAEYLSIRALTGQDALRARVRDIDYELLDRYLVAFHAVCNGDADGGPVAMTSMSERFHWLTAPRSDVLQCSPVHEGVCDVPAAELESLYRRYVGE